MTLLRLILKEIGHRKMNFCLSILTVALASASWLICEAFLESANRQAAAKVSKKVEQTQASLKKLEDNIRKSMKGLGFNVSVFPEGQDMGEVYSEGYASKTMPEDYVHKLATSHVLTINHLLPTLTQSLEWPEQKRKIVLIGIRGEVPKSHGKPKPALIDPLAPDEIALGYELHTSLGLAKGDTVTLLGRELTLTKTHPQRGSKDDITAWINLAVCQELLDKKGLINSILALQCNCASVDRAGEIRDELTAILPDTQVVEYKSRALARAEARSKTKETSEKEIASMKHQQRQLREDREWLVAVLVPFIALLALATISLLALLNVKDRVYEVGLLLSIGVKPSTILTAFLLKALCGALLGVLLGVGLFYLCLDVGSTKFFAGYPASELVEKTKLLLTVIVAPLLVLIATWLPAFWATQTDPAEVLKND